MTPLKKTVYSGAGIIFLLLFWEIASLISACELLLPGPLPVLVKFFTLVRSKIFLRSLAGSLGRVFLAMAISAPLGILAGIIAALDKRAGAFLRPLFQIISATPVIPLILIAFLWFGQSKTAVFTAFLMIFPVITANTMSGIQALDPLLRELFTLYKLPFREKFFSLYLPGIAPFVAGGLSNALSQCWKVVVAAEVLLQPRFSLGIGMQNARAGLETAELFAWTIGAVLAAAVTQLILNIALEANRRKIQIRK
ncbi:MAG: ABC transporter permease subunit [Treponema sp.]|nr:ABC transporter permease subunit [Treponema sp.]